MSNRVAVIILISWFIGGNAGVSYGNEKNFQVERLGSGGGPHNLPAARPYFQPDPEQR